MGLLLDHFHHVISDGLRDFLEPMRYAGGDDDHISFAEVVRLSTAHVLSALLTGSSDMAANHRAASDERGGTLENVKGVGFLVVDFDFTTAVARYHQDRQIRSPNDRGVVGDFVVRDIRDLCITHRAHQQGTRRQEQKNAGKFHTVRIRPPDAGGPGILQ